LGKRPSKTHRVLGEDNHMHYYLGWNSRNLTSMRPVTVLIIFTFIFTAKVGWFIFELTKGSDEVWTEGIVKLGQQVTLLLL
jgi:hypothetical protein